MNKTALILAAIAAILCIGKFIHSLTGNNEPDYFILIAGIFVLGFAASSYLSQKKN